MQLIEALIRHDSLALSLPGGRGQPIMNYVVPLRLLVQVNPQTYSPGHETVILRSLLHLKYAGGVFFTQQDSLTLVQQAQQQQEARLDTTRLTPGDWLNPQVFKRLEKQMMEPAYYRFSQPLFSRDSSRAYILLNNFCVFCGGGIAILAERKNGRWQPVDKRIRWKN
ncbi:hypothetical protein GCM10027346_42660 [Hymenobacter seoulensis]